MRTLRVMNRTARARRLVTASAVLLVALVALSTRLLAVNNLSIDYDEDDYLRAGQLYAVGLQAGDLSVLTSQNYRIEHPPLTKIVTGLALTPLPAAPIVPDQPTSAEPAASLPQPQFAVARLVNVLFGVGAAVTLAVVSPLAGLFLAIHTWTIKYTSQVMLESVPAFFAVLSVVLAWRAWRSDRPGRRRAWLVGAAAAFGMACAGKYLYGVAGLAIAADWLLRTRTVTRDDAGRWSATGVARWLAPVGGWFVLGAAVFLVFDPYLWPDPVGRLWASISYHAGYATSSTEVKDANFPLWQPINWLAGSVPWRDHGPFVVTADLVISMLGLVGARRLWREHRVFALWFLIGLAFLLVWPTKWPQYILVISAPVSLAAAHGAAIAAEALRGRIRAFRERRAAVPLTGPEARRAARGNLRDLRRASPWLIPGLIGIFFLAVIPIVYELLISTTDLQLKNLRDGLQGGVLRESIGGITGQIAAVQWSTDPTAKVQYVGLDLLNSVQAGIPIGNTSAATLVFSVLWMVSSVTLQAILGIAVALVLERPGIRFANAWRVLFILPWAIPEAVGAIAWMDIAHPQQGLFSKLVGGPVDWQASPELSFAVLLLAATWMGWPLWMLVATAGLRTIPRSVTEAAMIEGAGRWRTFSSVTLPLLLPLLGAAFVVRGVAAFNQFYLFFILGPAWQTSTLANVSYILFNSGFGPALFSLSAAINIGTMVVLGVFVWWFLRWRSRAERVAFR